MVSMGLNKLLQIIGYVGMTCWIEYGKDRILITIEIHLL